MRFAALTSILIPMAATAQVPGVGVGWLLNPEGSRLFPQPVIYPRHPGKPDPRWKVFDWHYRDFKTQATPWRLYFYDVADRYPAQGADTSYWTAEYAAPVIDSQIRELAATFGFWPSERFSYLLFSSYREFQQANVFFIEEGVQGVTSTLEPTMAIPYWGERETFRHISHHELVHQFQVQRMGRAGVLIPLWMIEGMAEYYSLRGLDTESLALLRDLYFNQPDESDKLRNFLEPGPYDFQHVYKLGQLKLAFLEERYGQGTIQRLFNFCIQKLGTSEAPDLAAALLRTTGGSLAELQKKWAAYLKSRLADGFEAAAELGAFPAVEGVGKNLDLYSISPDGRSVLWREVDPLTGGASLWVGPLAGTGRGRKKVIHDRQSSAVSLYFLQAPSIAISNRSVAFFAATTQGPELELRTYTRSPQDEILLGPGGRIRLHEYGLVQAHSPTFEPAESRVAFVGINAKGWQNIYVVDASPRDRKPKLRQLTFGAFAWRSLCWTGKGILASSDRGSPSGLYGVQLVDPVSLAIRPLVLPGLGHENLLEAVATDPDREIYLRSANGHGQQIYRWTPESGLERVTFVKTLMIQPQISAAGVHALGFQKSRYRLVRIPSRKPASTEDWDATEVTPFPTGSVQNYRAFRGTGYRIEDFGAFFSSGAILGLSGTFSDLMRNQIVSADLLALSGQGITQADVIWTSEEGRATWTLGAYHSRALRLDSIFSSNTDTLLYRHDETGALGAYQYPLGAFQYVTGGLRVAHVNRSGFSDEAISPLWEAVNPGGEWLVAPTLSYGLDHIEYELYSGPIKGFGLLLEAGTEWFPGRKYASERLRLDVAHYQQLWGRSLLALHGLGGFSFSLSDGPDFRNPFYVSSDDIFRAYSFSDERLRGNYVLGAKAELRFPVGELFGFEPLRGIVAADLGSIWRDSDRTLRRISQGATSSWSSGFAFNIPPISFSFLVTRPIRVASRPAGPSADQSLVHFTLRYLYL